MSEKTQTKLIIHLARETAAHGLNLLSENEQDLPKIAPEKITSAFLATIVAITLTAMPCEDREMVKQDILNLIGEYKL